MNEPTKDEIIVDLQSRLVREHTERIALDRLMEERKEYAEALRAADDRRYAEVNIEKEKALKIKEEADKAALGLAREIQTYKDEKANELREQINSERGLYASKTDLASLGEKIETALRPIQSWMSAQQGVYQKGGDVQRQNNWFVGIVVSLVSIACGVAVALLLKK